MQNNNLSTDNLHLASFQHGATNIQIKLHAIQK